MEPHLGGTKLGNKLARMRKENEISDYRIEHTAQKKPKLDKNGYATPEEKEKEAESKMQSGTGGSGLR